MAEQRNTVTDGGTAGTGETEVLPERRADAAGGEGQGDDRADRFGGREGGGAASPATGSGDARPGRSEGGGERGLGGPDSGSPGGMGGARVQGGTGTSRPPGGVSPVDKPER